MNTLRTAGVVLAIVASAMLVAGTLGITSTTADRDVSVSVADDQDAFVGFDATDHSNVTAGDQITVVSLTNRFGQPINVTDIELISGSDVSLDPGTLPTSIGPGEEASITASVDQCTASATEEVSVKVNVAGDGVAVELSDGETVSRSFEVSCADEN